MEDRLDFVGIGTYKSGTRWVVESLTDHPEIETAWEHRENQLNFFNVNYTKGFTWYHRRFEFDRPLAGEYSVDYLPAASVPERIHRYRPDIKLILALRDPVERAFSQHKHEVRRGSYEDPSRLSFERALEVNPSYLEYGYYHRQLIPWLETFERGDLHVLLLDEIKNEPAETVERLYRFLGVDPTHRPEHLGEAVHEGYLYRSRRLNELLRRIPDYLRERGAAPMVNLVRATGIPSLLRDFNKRDPRDVIPPMVEETEKRLRDRFREDIERLEAILDRDLSAWK